MQKTFFYWSPFLTEVGTVKSTINSAISLQKYSNSNYSPIIINACGEWDKYTDYLKEKNIKIMSLQKFNYVKYLPKYGFLGSRFSYCLIFLLSFIPLLKLLKKNRDSFFIAHLITSLPIFLFKIFRINNYLVLRISGMPKLNLLRKNFWKSTNNNIDFITCPSIQLLSKLKKINIFSDHKLFFLPDAIFQIENFIAQKKNATNINLDENKKYIIAIGRLTKQKNFRYLINEISEFLKKNENYKLLIIGDGEEKNELIRLANIKDLKKKISFLGNKKNVFEYIINSEIFILTSLWEDPGFVLIEAGLGNLFIISSDCPNGPKEILDYGRNGLLFSSNVDTELSKKLNEFVNLSEKKKYTMKCKLKKNIMKYSIFRHYLSFKNILEKLI
jgi:glycosyltransferase involved in cell wall biosynthesis